MKSLSCLLIFLSIIMLGKSQQTQTDSYTSYELLDVETESFRIIYDVSGTSEGAHFYWNTLRKGSDHEVNEVIDLFSGKPLDWDIVNGEIAKINGLKRATKDGEYLQIKLAGAIPKGGQARLRIDKTYRDPLSYFKEDDHIVFSRTLGIKRNNIILPPHYELLSCNYPSQVQLTENGRIKISFMNIGSQAIDLKVKAKRLNSGMAIRPPSKNTYQYDGSGNGRNRSEARKGWAFKERAFQNRDIVYFLQQPETHSFKLYHDYTETREGMDRYLNIVRSGSKASLPSAILLDTGENLKVEELKGEEINTRGIELNTPITEETELIAIWYEPVKKGESKRLRISETYTDTSRYTLHNDELLWDRSFGRNRNTVILPPNWLLTSSSIPAVIDQTENDLTRLRFINGRPDNIDVYVTAQRKY